MIYAKFYCDAEINCFLNKQIHKIFIEFSFTYFLMIYSYDLSLLLEKFPCGSLCRCQLKNFLFSYFRPLFFYFILSSDLLSIFFSLIFDHFFYVILSSDLLSIFSNFYINEIFQKIHTLTV